MDGKKTLHFGAEGADTFLEHKDEAKKSAWIKRHRSGNPDKMNDKTSPLFWSSNLLWNKTTLKESIKDIRNKHGLEVRMSYS
jgi:hypothetical protein